jgi:hypothetical protein
MNEWGGKQVSWKCHTDVHYSRSMDECCCWWKYLLNMWLVFSRRIHCCMHIQLALLLFIVMLVFRAPCKIYLISNVILFFFTIWFRELHTKTSCDSSNHFQANEIGWNKVFILLRTMAINQNRKLYWCENIVNWCRVYLIAYKRMKNRIAENSLETLSEPWKIIFNQPEVAIKINIAR